MEEDLIEAIYKREPLWNPDHKLYKNVPAIKLLWKEVAKEVKRDEKAVRMKWKNLRTYYYRELKKVEKTLNGDLDPLLDTITSWQYFKQMMFLKDKVSVEKRYFNVTLEDSDLNPLKESQDETLYASPLSTPNSSIVEERSKKKIKRLSSVITQRDEKIFELKKRKLEILEKESSKASDDDLLFFQSLLPYVKQIPVIQKLRLRCKIQDLIVKELDLDIKLFANE